MKEKAKPIVKGVEDKFYYYITDACINCGKCRENCPVGAIVAHENCHQILKEKCIDCGTCSYLCPVGAARPI